MLGVTCWAVQARGQCFSPWLHTRIPVEHLRLLLRDARVILVSGQGCNHRPNLEHMGREPARGRGRAEGTLTPCYPPASPGERLAPVSPASRAQGDGYPEDGWAGLRPWSQWVSDRSVAPGPPGRTALQAPEASETPLLGEETELRHEASRSVKSVKRNGRGVAH